MDYVVLCSTTEKCRPTLEQFLKENNIPDSAVVWNMIPYRVTLNETEFAWFVPKRIFERWSRGREYQIVHEVL